MNMCTKLQNCPAILPLFVGTPAALAPLPAEFNSRFVNARLFYGNTKILIKQLLDCAVMRMPIPSLWLIEDLTNLLSLFLF